MHLAASTRRECLHAVKQSVASALVRARHAHPEVGLMITIAGIQKVRHGEKRTLFAIKSFSQNKLEGRNCARVV